MTFIKTNEAIKPRTIVSLADPDSFGRAAMLGEDVEVIARVPVGAFPKAWECLFPIMDDGAPWLEDWHVKEGRSENELRLLCGLFWHIADKLPMDTKHFLEWQETVGVGQYLDDFAEMRVAALEAPTA